MSFPLPDLKCIDTHIHIWNFERASYPWLNGNTTILNKTYLITELEADREKAGVTEGMLVQAANSVEDTMYMLEVAEQNSWLKGVVGWLPLQQPGEVKRILSDGYAKHPLFKGVRHLIHDETDPEWLLQPAVIESLQLMAAASLPYDVVGVMPQHLETVLKLINKVPGLYMVMDHLNQPPIQQGEKFGKWGELISEVVKHPNMFAKISGLGTTTNKNNSWGTDDILPYVEFALEKFGINRCFCGGDWPVSLLAGTYTNTWNIYRQTLDRLVNKQEAEKILYSNASDFYQL